MNSSCDNLQAAMVEQNLA